MYNRRTRTDLPIGFVGKGALASKDKVDYTTDIINLPTLSIYAKTSQLFSGSYNDLTNLPTLGGAAYSSPSDFATAAQGAEADAAMPRTGGTFTGTIQSSGEIQSTSANTFRIAYRDRGTFWRNDNTTLWLLLTNSGDAFGSWNDLRPFQVALSTGKVTMGNGLSFGSQIAASPTDLSKHIALYSSANYGFSITYDTLNLVSGSHVYAFKNDGSVSGFGNLTATGTITGANLSGTNTGDQDLSGLQTALNAKANINSLPTNNSQLTNGAGYITGYTETDPTVPSWAKTANKPSYSYSEITGTKPPTTADQTSTHNAASATKLATTRTIAGHSFDGTQNVTITAGDVGAATAAQGAKADSAVQPGSTPTLTSLELNQSTVNDIVGLRMDSSDGWSYYDHIGSYTRIFGASGTGDIYTWEFNRANGSFSAQGPISGSNLSGTNTGDQDLSGLMPKSGGTFTSGINFANQVASSATDLNKHIALYSNTYGFSITSNMLNMVSSGHVYAFNSSGDVYGVRNLTTTGTITAPSIYIGNDSYLVDINVANTFGVYGQEDATKGGIKLGSSGPTISSNGSNLSISGGVTAPSISVSGEVTGSNLSGTNTGDQDLSGLMPKSGGTFTGSVDFGNHVLTGVGSITTNDPGHGEGINFGEGNGWFIEETPDSGANSAGNLQFGRNNTRYLTLDTGGNFSAPTITLGSGKPLSKISCSSSAPGALANGELYLEY